MEWGRIFECLKNEKICIIGKHGLKGGCVFFSESFVVFYKEY